LGNMCQHGQDTTKSTRTLCHRVPAAPLGLGLGPRRSSSAPDPVPGPGTLAAHPWTAQGCGSPLRATPPMRSSSPSTTLNPSHGLVVHGAALVPVLVVVQSLGQLRALRVLPRGPHAAAFPRPSPRCLGRQHTVICAVPGLVLVTHGCCSTGVASTRPHGRTHVSCIRHSQAEHLAEAASLHPQPRGKGCGPVPLLTSTASSPRLRDRGGDRLPVTGRALTPRAPDLGLGGAAGCLPTFVENWTTGAWATQTRSRAVDTWGPRQ
jgi:hypothetical protein